MKVAVCVTTYKRPHWLAVLLRELALQALPAHVEWRVIVVDNDPAMTARELVESQAAAFPVRLDYYCQPVRGISAARNMCVEQSSDADFVAFIDDDEYPEPQWLAQLLAVQQASQAEAVTGPVYPEYVESPPAWVLKGRFHGCPCHANGAAIHDAATNNVLINRKLFDHWGLRFDPEMGLAGGEDTLFFMQAQEKGARIVWAEAAAVHEAIPPGRVTARWLVQRWFRMGNALAIIDRKRGLGLAGALVRLGKGGLRVVRGALLLIGIVWGDKALAVRGMQNLARGVGTFTGMLAFQYNEYKER